MVIRVGFVGWRDVLCLRRVPSLTDDSLDTQKTLKCDSQLSLPLEQGYATSAGLYKHQVVLWYTDIHEEKHPYT